MSEPKIISLTTKLEKIYLEFSEKIDKLVQNEFISKLESVKEEFNSNIKSLNFNEPDKINQRDIYISSLKIENDALKDLHDKIDSKLKNKLKKAKKIAGRRNDETYSYLHDKINDIINDNSNEDNSSSKGINDSSFSFDAMSELISFYDSFNTQETQEDIPEKMKDIKEEEIPKINQENSGFNSSSNGNSMSNKSISKCKIHKDKNAVYYCKVHQGEYFCEDCYGLLGGKSEHGVLFKISNLINSNSSASQNDAKKDNFLEWFKFFFRSFYQKCNILFNLNIIPDLEKYNEVNLVEIEEQKRFINAVFAKFSKLTMFEIEDTKPNVQMVNMLKDITSANRIILQSAEININMFEIIEKHSKFAISILPHRNLINSEKLTQEIKSITNYYYSEFHKNYNISTDNAFLIVNDYIDEKNHKNIYIIKEKKILKSMAILNEIHDLKLNFLIKVCKINPNKLEAKYDSIYFKQDNNTTIKGEKYYSPEGYFGIGIKIENDDNLPFAYLTLSNKFTKKQLECVFNELIENKKLDKIENKKENKAFDKNHWAKIGTGIYLFPNIATAEKHTGTFEINGKQYKIVIMVKVMKDKIKQPKIKKSESKESENKEPNENKKPDEKKEPDYNDYGYWVVEKDYVKICRILFKENDKF